MSTLREAGERVYGNSLCYFCNFHMVALFQNKNFLNETGISKISGKKKPIIPKLKKLVYCPPSGPGLLGIHPVG